MSDNIVLFVIILCEIDLNAGRVSETPKKNTQKYAKIKGEKKRIAVWLKYACEIARAQVKRGAVPVAITIIFIIVVVVVVVFCFFFHFVPSLFGICFFASVFSGVSFSVLLFCLHIKSGVRNV